MTITLPDEWRERLENAAKRTGYTSVEEYILSLAEDAENEDEFLANLPGPPQLTPRSREELERMLDEGVNSGPPIVADAAFWEERKRLLREKLERRQGVSE
jgi:predicted kinase